MVMEKYQGLHYRSDEPHVALDRPVLLIVDDRHRTLVGLEVIQLEHVFLKPIIHRTHQVGDTEEPPLDGGLLQFYTQTLVHLYLAVEGKVVGKLANREFRKYRRACIALGKRLGRNWGSDNLIVCLAHGLVADGNPHVGIGASIYAL